MKTVSKALWQTLTLSTLIVGCSGPVDGAADFEQEEAGAQTSEIRNGTLYDGNPTGLWNGVVKVEFLQPASNSWATCSGQVVSAQTILTAAHCFAGLAGGNPASMWVRASRPAPGGGWTTVLPKTWAYVKHNPAYQGLSATNDVGLVIAPNGTSLQNVFLGDAVPLSKSAPNIAMTALGFGYYTATQFDGLGRSGPVTPTYDAVNHDYRYIGGPRDTHMCSGDSGGPIKTTSLVYGIMSLGHGVTVDKCSTGGRWAPMVDNMAWLKANIAKKLYCSETATQYSCW